MYRVEGRTFSDIEHATLFAQRIADAGMRDVKIEGSTRTAHPTHDTRMKMPPPSSIPTSGT